MVGAGALGNEVIKALGLLGVRHILVIDPDVVEPGNLNRSIFFRQKNFTGTNKAQAMMEAAGPLFPDTCFHAVNSEIADTSTSLLTEAEMIFSCVDSDLARLEIAYLSTKFDIPVAEGGLGGHLGSRGRSTWFPGRRAACYGCKLPARRRRELLTHWQAQPHPCRIPPGEISVPSTPTMAAIIGSMQVELGLKNLLEGKTSSESMELSLDGKPRLEQIENKQAAECPFHVSPPELRVRAQGNETVGSILRTTQMREFANSYIHLDWPVCTDAQCLACGQNWTPMVRAGYLRRHGSCPHCLAREFLVLESVQNLGLGDRWAECPVSDFGIAPGHWISVRVG